MITPRRARAPRQGSGGFSLVELSIVMVIMTVAVGMLSSTLTSSSRVGPLVREEALAGEALRFQLETLRSTPFDELWARYNLDPSDDPEGPGTAPGRHFEVEGLEPRADDADGHVGRIEFPELDGHLREDLAHEALGMPRDLDGDRAVGSAPVDGRYELLPLVVVVEWQGANGPRTLRLYSAMVTP
jgi:prepilin-type N-terminal cleavage/methylation domain-containing protein